MNIYELIYDDNIYRNNGAVPPRTVRADNFEIADTGRHRIEFFNNDGLPVAVVFDIPSRLIVNYGDDEG